MPIHAEVIEPLLALQLEQELGCHPARYLPRAIAQRRIRAHDVGPATHMSKLY